MSLNVLTRGTGGPLLALHGFTGTAHSWSAQLPAWSDVHRVIVPDLLGHGGSDAPDDPGRYKLDRQADALVGLLDLLEAVPVSVVGYSMGARLALVLALDHPDAVERLVLESPSAGIADEAQRAARRAADEATAAMIERDGMAAFVEAWESQPIFASHAALPADVLDRQRWERMRHTATGLAASLRGAGQGAMSPLHQRLSEVPHPTLVVAGALDATGLDRARVVANSIPNARLEIVDGAGHTPHLERPDVFTAATLDFLSIRPVSHAR